MWTCFDPCVVHGAEAPNIVEIAMIVGLSCKNISDRCMLKSAEIYDLISEHKVVVSGDTSG